MMNESMLPYPRNNDAFPKYNTLARKIKYEQKIKASKL